MFLRSEAILEFQGTNILDVSPPLAHGKNRLFYLKDYPKVLLVSLVCSSILSLYAYTFKRFFSNSIILERFYGGNGDKCVSPPSLISDILITLKKLSVSAGVRLTS